MLNKLKESSFLSFFLADKKKNSLLSAGMLFFNILSALLEGVSFAFLLFGLTALNGEKRFLPQSEWVSDLSSIHLFALLLLGAILAQFLRSIFAYFGQLATSYLTVNIQTISQHKIYSQIFRLSYRCVSRYKVGDLIYHATAPPAFFPQVMDGFNKLVVSSMMVLAYLVFMSYLSVILTLYVCLLFFLASTLQKFVFKKIMSASHAQATHTTELNKETAQNLEGLKIVHLFARQSHILNKVKSTLKAIAQSTFQLCKWNHLVLPINEMIAILVVGASIFLGILFLENSAVLPSLLMTYLTLTYRLGTRLQTAMTSWGTIVYYFGPFKRMKEILRDDDKEFIHATGKENVSFHDAIYFKNVSFSYPKKKADSIYEISFTIPKGKTIAIVGSSGGGKSTLLSLLLRLFEPSRGEICIDGENISNIHLSHWRALFGVVNQDVFLFHDTVYANICFGNLAATQEEVIEVAKLAGAHPFIEHLPQGYQTVIGEKGHRLSGGERQRISLARALVRQPEILVLDEATSHLDSHSEKLIQQALEGLRGKTTMLVVAHRLATIKRADQIILVEKGKIVEQGTHTELINLRERYHHFWSLQTSSVDQEENSLVSIF